MSANYLKSLPYVDTDRIGIWGLSYGGFFTLIAMTDQPTLFRAGVDVAGVVDYVMYYSDTYHGDWTESRIGRPEQNRKSTRRLRRFRISIALRGRCSPCTARRTTTFPISNPFGSSTKRLRRAKALCFLP